MIGMAKIKIPPPPAPPTSGNLYAWGLVTGIVNLSNPSSPVQVGSRSDWVKFDVCQHALLIDTAGKLWACGENSVGAMGDGTRVNKSSPVQIGAATDWSFVSVGGAEYSNNEVSAAIRGGKLFTWGYNANGNLGLGNTNDRSSPVQVGAETDWEFVSVSSLQMAAIRGGRLFTCGSNYGGQCGLGDTNPRSSPVQVGSDSDWTWVSMGDYNCFGIKGGQLYAWGKDDYGALGLGTSGFNRSVPVRVGTGGNWTMVSNALNEFQCSAIAGGLLFSWGAGAYGALGRGNISDYNTPVQIGAASDWTWISRKIFYGACGLRGGKAFTWGFNNYGQIGNGNVGTTYSSPVQIGAATDWKLIMCGDENTMGIRLV